MNYRHAFHAGNFADVMKHAVLARILDYLKQKPSAFRVIDTHAGAGRFDLMGEQASRTGEWRDGIGRLAATTLDNDSELLLAPYRTAITAVNGEGVPLATYPGSPLIVLHHLRPHDRLIACEKEPEAAAALAATLRRDRRAKVIAIDGWTALGAAIPPKERRGLVLIDPPFEQPDEAERIAEGLATCRRKWPTGSVLIWYPVKDPTQTARLLKMLKPHGPGALRLEITVGPDRGDGRLRGSGLLAINPPWTLETEMRHLLPALAKALSPDGGGGARIEALD